MGEVVEELFEGFVLRLFCLREAVEGMEWFGFAVIEDGADARHPVGAIAADEVTDDVEGTPGIFSFVAACPGVGKAAQEGRRGLRAFGRGVRRLRRRGVVSWLPCHHDACGLPLDSRVTRGWVICAG